MILCCGELNLDDEQIDRDLEEVWVRQRYRCLESKKPRKVLMEQQLAEEEQLVTTNHRRGVMMGKNGNNPNNREESIERIRYDEARRQHRANPRSGASAPSSAPRARTSSAPRARPWMKNGRQIPQAQTRGRSGSIQNKRHASKERNVQPSVNRSWSLDSRSDGDIRVRSNSRPRDYSNPRQANQSSSDNRRRGMNYNSNKDDYPKRNQYNNRAMDALPPRPQLNVPQKRRVESNNRHTEKYIVARQGENMYTNRNGYYMNNMEVSHPRNAANQPPRQYVDYRDDSRSWSSDTSSSEEGNVGMGDRKSVV